MILYKLQGGGPKVKALGISGTLSPGVSLSAKVATDKFGNISLFGSSAFVATSDAEANIAVFYEFSDTLMITDDMKGNSVFTGAGADTTIGPSVDYTYGFNYDDNGNLMDSHTVGIGVGASFVPAEIHTGVSTTDGYTFNYADVLTEALYNVFDFFNGKEE